MPESEYTGYQECYIAFLDMLGFREKVKTYPCEVISWIFESIEKEVHEFHTYDYTSISSEAMKALNMKVMSDSICIYVDKSKEGSLSALICGCTALQAMLLRKPEPVLIRGSIVCGKIFAKGDVTFGPGLTAAYLMEEKNAEVPRIIFCKDIAMQALSKSDTDSISSKVIDTMTFRDYDAFYTLNYFTFFRALDSTGNDRIALKKHIQQVLNSTVDASIRKKYLYLEEKFNQYC